MRTLRKRVYDRNGITTYHTGRVQSNIFHEGSGKRIKGVVEIGRQSAGIIVGGCSKGDKQKAGSEPKGVASEKGQGEI